MGSAASHAPSNALVPKYRHASEVRIPADGDDDAAAASSTDLHQRAPHACRLPENGMSSDCPSNDGGSSEKSESPLPRFSSATTAADAANRNLNNAAAGVAGEGRKDVTADRGRSISLVPVLSEYATIPLQHVHRKLRHNHRVFRICLTGGPCAGKSTFLTQLQSKMSQRTGYKVFCVPEAATLLVTGGMKWSDDSIEDQQLALLRVQLALEDEFYHVAMACGEPSIVISDRGTMDGRAFCSEETFARILKRLNVTLETLRDRYDAVIHLVTAACGAVEYYNLDNPARYENVEEAVESDKKLRQVYVGHPMLRIIDNSTTFEEKIERGLSLIGQIIGQKFSMHNTSHYLVQHCSEDIPVKTATYTLVITVLCNSNINDIRLLVRREHSSGECMYFFNSLLRVNRGASTRQGDGSEDSSLRDVSSPPCHVEFQAVQGVFMGTSESSQHVKNEQRITFREYNSLIRHRDVQRRDVVLHAVQFIHDNSRYEVTTIIEPSWAAGKQALSLERDDNETVVFPSFIEVDREVPIDSFSTAFLISHAEMGPLYTSLAYAPVFTRAVVAKDGNASSNKKRSTKNVNNNNNNGCKEIKTPPPQEKDTHNDSKTKSKTTKKKKDKHHKKPSSANNETATPQSRTPVMTPEAAAAVEGLDTCAPNPLQQPKLGPIEQTSMLPLALSSSPPPLPSGPPTANPRGAMANMR